MGDAFLVFETLVLIWCCIFTTYYFGFVIDCLQRSCKRTASLKHSINLKSSISDADLLTCCLTTYLPMHLFSNLLIVIFANSAFLPSGQLRRTANLPEY